MRSLLIIPMLCLSFLSYAGDIPMRISDTVTVAAPVSPDVMTSSVSASNTSIGFKSVAVQMEKITSVVKAHSDACTFSSYSITPKYRYESGKKISEGYQGSIYIPCRFTDMRMFESFLNDMESVVSSDPAYEMSLSPVVWNISDELSKSVKTSLKNKALGVISKKADQYSRTSDRQCFVSTVSFDGPAAPEFDTPMARASSFKLEVSQPDKKGSDITVSAAYSLVCK